MLEIVFNLNNDNKEPLYMQIYKHIKDEILCGNIPSESKLPSIRTLCKDLKVSKNTVEAAYEQLIAEGYVKPKNRSGLYVEKMESGFSNLKIISSDSYKENIPKTSYPQIKYDFSSGQIDLSSFPYTQFRKILTRCVDEYSKELLLYGDHKGDYGLRYEIAKYIHHSRGVRCSPEQILISSGTQESLNLLCLILLNLHSNIAFENPSYIGAKDVFKNFNFNINPINLNEDGIDINALSKSNSKIVYVTPSHQYPYGMVMPISRRLKLLNWANENNGIIIEDDYDGEFRYKGKSIPSLQGLDETGRVVYLGSFSKSLMPSLRISYLVLPQFLLDVYEEKYRTYEQPVPRLIQKTIELFMKEGYWDKHLRKSKVLYKKKQEILINSIAKYFGDNVNIIGADSGLHILIQINTTLKENELIGKALNAGIKVHPTLVSWVNPPNDILPVIFIGFAGIQIEHIPEAIEALSECWL
ncbi:MULTISPECIES: PLP-dependent aminotransferase family protein [unclassified Clostridium]|uniref:MocR-like pyridoxine biosynthesis transcription factor PdxR n=1 Tax=unclassified Clostridium TaxID=2614128 RepID=UPI000297B9E6|nr:MULTISPECIES: PLP-dependent aminotransferase family protein [unclassified Clostridium]EKQ53794.1 MAG: transcriptional regulator (HTH and aminotransferase domain containing protein) [Clostridium sp. Maddingley MBC34-26]